MANPCPNASSAMAQRRQDADGGPVTQPIAPATGSPHRPADLPGVQNKSRRNPMLDDLLPLRRRNCKGWVNPIRKRTDPQKPCLSSSPYTQCRGKGLSRPPGHGLWLGPILTHVTYWEPQKYRTSGAATNDRAVVALLTNDGRRPGGSLRRFTALDEDRRRLCVCADGRMGLADKGEV